ncbi:lipopolysaccharide biosynthesis protein [Mongoliitalea daihaiensis]|uniref:lipopolysaccharide biosynthesis protein n=1 Tax=Mongoliitalea daihaiensis TaxID=2782006 RepID=UPI001F2A7D77|nr:hypothetical protein [Mongoliitalea daihaiensis]UJP64477.1 hypothetical protein IPZ59_16975 [Mongoliitalea daihaiensis]
MLASKKVINNTAILYVQLILSMAFGLFTTRIILDALGEVNFGIFALISGVIGMLGILNSNMSSASMRFIAHALGKNNLEISLKTFNTTLLLHFGLAFLVVIFMEIGGYVFFEQILKIPNDKINEAWILFHLMVLTTFISIISVPYDAVMNAHEDLLAMSVVDLAAVILRFAGAIYLSYSTDNVLVKYGIILLIIELSVRFTKQLFSVFKYHECKIRLKTFFDKKIFNDIIAYTSWNIFGSLGAMATTRLNGVFINYFFGVSLNASEGLSSNISSKINMVSVSLTRAINPQIMKSEGSGDRLRMLRISELSTKYSIFLFALIGIPFFLNVDFLVNLWLKDVPPFTIIFTKLLIVILFIEKLSFEITTAIKATGKIKSFQISETTIRIISAFSVYIALNFYSNPVAIYLVGILFSLFILMNRLLFGKLILNLNILSFLSNTTFKVIPLIMLTVIPSILLFSTTLTPFYLFILSSTLFVFLFSTSFYLFSMKESEKKIVLNLFKK